MSNYVKTTDFASKDTLASGNPLKTIKGTEFDVEFNNLATASSSKANTATPTFTGVPAAPTATAGNSTTQLATTAFVTTAVGSYLLKTGGAMTGAITTNSTFDGRDVATDGTKLDTVETSATADQTAAQITALGIAATSVTGSQASAITANTAKTGITAGQASAIIANTAKVTNSTSASDLTSGTLPDARFPATLPAISGANLTNLPVAGEDNLGYLNIPQNSKSAAYTLVLADAGKHILHPSADTTARTFTIPANGSVAYVVGTAITFVNQNSGGDITIAITSDTMRLAGDGSTGSRTLAENGVATAIKIASTNWIISGGSALT